MKTLYYIVRNRTVNNWTSDQVGGSITPYVFREVRRLVGDSIAFQLYHQVYGPITSILRTETLA